MKPSAPRLALLLASAAALTLVASPAVASVPSTSGAQAAAHAPTGVLTPAKTTWAHLLAHGVTDRFSHLTPGATYTVGWFGGADATKANSGGAAEDTSGNPIQVTASGTGTASTTWYGNGIEGLMGVVTVDLIDSHGDWIAQDQLEVKRGTYVAVTSAHRSGTALTIQAEAHYWSLATKARQAWAHHPVVVQERRAGAWHTVATAKTDANGVATATVHGGTHTWRVALLPTRGTYGSVSAEFRR